MGECYEPSAAPLSFVDGEIWVGGFINGESRGSGLGGYHRLGSDRSYACVYLFMVLLLLFGQIKGCVGRVHLFLCFAEFQCTKRNIGIIVRHSK